MKFKLWQSADMQEPVKLIKANSYKKALELALEVCGYTLTQGGKDDEACVFDGSVYSTDRLPSWRCRC